MYGVWDPRVLVGRKIEGRYKLLEPLARGGMGVVFRAIDVNDGLQLAVKVLHPEAALDPDMVARFFSEADALRRIDHPNVVRIIESGEDPDLSPWIAMELVEGENLAVRLLRSRAHGERALPTDEVLSIGVDVSLALELVHALGLLHRDVKPSNIVTDRTTKKSKLVDFGISKRVHVMEPCPMAITRPGDFIGTTDYAAPEQWTGEAQTASDVYSLALTLAEALGGEPRFLGGEHRGWPIILRPLILRREPERLISVLASSLAEAPERRPTSTVLRAELEAVRAEKTTMMRGPKKPERCIEHDAPVDRERETRLPFPLHPSAADAETKFPSGELRLGKPRGASPEVGSGPDRMYGGAQDVRREPRGASPEVGSGPDRMYGGAQDVRRETGADSFAETLRAKIRSRPVRSAAIRVLRGAMAALVLATLGVVGWDVARTRSHFGAVAQAQAAPPFAQGEGRAWSDARYERIARTKAAIGELAGAFARDMRAPKAERDQYLRYDCARMARLSVDVEGVDHPLAYEGRDRLRTMASKYGERCQRVLERERR